MRRVARFGEHPQKPVRPHHNQQDTDKHPLQRPGAGAQFHSQAFNTNLFQTGKGIFRERPLAALPPCSTTACCHAHSKRVRNHTVEVEDNHTLSPSNPVSSAEHRPQVSGRNDTTIQQQQPPNVRQMRGPASRPCNGRSDVWHRPKNPPLDSRRRAGSAPRASRANHTSPYR
ncbi:hypothetical protein PhaeoP54_02205 [Phaeobacter inhibens]|nr:hypothetical protein PhaeoP54_02205 [Phaeobacter inhibens]